MYIIGANASGFLARNYVRIYIKFNWLYYLRTDGVIAQK